VLQQEAHQQAMSRPFLHAAAALRAAGVKPACALVSTPEAYYVGCIAPWTGETMPELLSRTPQGLKSWRPVYLRRLGRVVYIPAGSVLTPTAH
jgi:hypothetical protein